MKPEQESDSTSGDEEEDQLNKPGDSISGRQQPSLPSLSGSEGDAANPASGPAQKRRRVTRACDECRRKKIKCDGKQPCTHCTVYSYECTYDQPSNRRRNPAPAYVEGLEGRLQKAQVILNSIAPGIDLADPKFDSQSIDQIIASSRSRQHSSPPDSSRTQEDDHQMQTIVEATGQLDLDDQGNLDYHGNSSSFVFMRNLRSQFGALSVPDPRIPIPQRSTFSHLVGSPTSTSTTSSRFDQSPDRSSELPDRETAIQLSTNALDIACALMGFVHKPKFYSRLDQLYDTAPDNYTNSNIQFLPLLYMVMAVGCLFTPSDDTQPDSQHQGAVQQGYVYFQTARGMLNIPDCRNLITLQAIIFKIMFLQSSARLSTCYSYIGIAQRTCCRLGMHRDLNHDFDLIEREERKRAFWLIRALDAYVSALLGLPQLLNEDDVDQPLPLEMSDEFITPTEILPAPPGQFHAGVASHAQIRLMWILQKVVRYVYPVKSGKAESQARWSISQSKIREIETDLQSWMDALPVELKPDDNASRESARVQRLLRFSYAHLQMMLYRPFLHFVSQRCRSENLDRRSYACAAACVSVTRNIVHIAAEMRRRQLLSGSQWFIVYTTYLAVVSLVYFVFENPTSNSARDIMKDAAEGKRLLAKLAKESSAAERCYHSLAAVFIELPAKLQEQRASIKPGPASRKRASEKEAATTEVTIRLPSQGEGSKRPLREDAPAGAARSRRQKPSSTAKRKESKTSPVHPVEQRTSTVASSVAASDDGRGSRYGDDSAYRPATSTSASFPDLQGLMYPSPNPFAYGNQPLSTLEDNQALQSASQPLEPEPMHIDPSERAGMPGYNLGHFNHPTFIPPQPEQPWQNSDGPLGDANAYPMPPRPPGPDPSMGTNETFWQQLARGPPGLTPGVGMEDVFGAHGWNTMYPNPEFRRFGQ